MPTAHSLFLNFESLLIKDFQDHLEKKGASQVTRKNYISDIRNFLSRVSLSDSAEGISGKLNKYIVESSQTYSPATLKRKLSSLRIFCNWAVEMGYLKENLLDTSGSDSSASQEVGEIGRPVTQSPETQASRYSDTPSFPTPRISNPPLPPRMPKELTTPYKVKDPESLFLHRVKITTAAVSGFGSVFVLLFIAKSIFGDALIFGPSAMNNQEQKPVEVDLPAQAGAPLQATTVSFGDLLAQTPTVLGVSTQKATVLSQSTAHGSATLSAGSREIALYSPNLTTSSRITVIPENSIEGTLLVSRDTPGSYFTVAVDRPIPSDIPFEWEIVELQNTQ